MKKFTLTTLLMAIIISMISQTQITFEKTYGGINNDVGTSIIQTLDGGYMIVGYTSSYGNGGFDIFLIRTDEYGDTLWTKTIGGINDDYAYSILESLDSGYVIWGKTKSYGPYEDNFYFLKINSIGDTLWSRTFNGYNSPSYIKTSGLYKTYDNEYILTGTKFPTGNYIKGYVIKTDSAGNQIWDYNMTNSYMYAGLKSPDSTFLFMGRDFIGTMDMCIFELHEAITTINYINTYNYDYNNYYGEGFSIFSCIQGGYLLTGFGGSSSYNYKMHIAKVDSAFNLEWDTLYVNSELSIKSSPNGEKDFLTIQTLDNGYAFVGRNSTLLNIRLFKTDPNANIIWSQLFSGLGYPRPYDVIPTSDGGYAIIGSTQVDYLDGNNEVYLIKTDSLGNTLTTINRDDICKESILIYPNPSTGKISIEAEEIEKIEVLNIEGKQIYTGKENEIDLSKNPKGIYIIKVTSKKGVAVEKIVLE